MRTLRPCNLGLFHHRIHLPKRMPPPNVLRIGSTPVALPPDPEKAVRSPAAKQPDAVTDPWLQSYKQARASLNYEHDYYIEDAWVRIELVWR